MKYKTKNVLKKVLSIGLACVIGVGAIAGISALANKSDDDGKVKINPSYSIGGLDDQGKYVESDATLYTKDAFECQGLTIKPDFDSNVKYQIFFYDEMGEFVNATSVLENAYTSAVPVKATHARLELTPVWSDDVKEKDRVIKWHNKNQWTDNLEIRVNEEQVSYDLPFEGENLFKYTEACSFNMNLGVEGFYLKDQGTGIYNASDLIVLNGRENICIKIDEALLSDVKLITLSSNEYLGDKALNTFSYQESTVGDSFYITIEVEPTWAGIALYADKTVDFSNTELYVW